MIQNLDQLREQVDGPVLLPGDEGYAAECATFNLLTPLSPAVAVGATSTADVQAAVRFAASNGLGVAIRGGGHLQPRNGADAVLITLDRMASVTVDAGRAQAVITGSARWGQVVDACAPHGLAPLNGSTPTVSAIGYTLGGGQSPTLGRRHGYASDHVIEFEVVTADGTARVVDHTREPELFHALKGTRGNLGVVTRMTIGLLPVPSIYAGGLFFPGEQMGALLPIWRDWAAGLPETATTSIAVDRLPDVPTLPPPLRGAFLLHVRFAYLGAPTDGEALLALIRAAGAAVVDTVADIPYAESATIHADPLEPLPYLDRGLGLRELSDETLAAFLAATGPDSGCPLVTVEIRALGGALDRAPAGPDAVPSRGLPFQVLGIGAGGPDDVPALSAALDRLVEGLRPWEYDHEMANFMTVDEAGDQAELRKVYGSELYDRILATKEKYDPHNLFRVNFTFAREGADGGRPTADTDLTAVPDSVWVMDQARLVEQADAAGTTDSIAAVLDDVRAPLVIVTTIGSRTGKPHRTPLIRVEHGGRYALIASKGGAAHHPAWYYNIRAHARVELWDGRARRSYVAREVSGEERDTWYARGAAVWPSFIDYRAKTTRVIPVLVLEPEQNDGPHRLLTF